MIETCLIGVYAMTVKLERFPVTVERWGFPIELSVPALSPQDAADRVNGDAHSNCHKLMAAKAPERGSDRREGGDKK